jgi:hypothetical protein
VKPSRGEWDEDVVDRVKASGTADPLTLELMQEVVYLRNEVAKLMRAVATQRIKTLALANERNRNG